MVKIPFYIPVPDFIMRLCVWGAVLYRKCRYGCTFRRIPLTRGQYAIVDVEDFAELNKYKWFASKYSNSFYARRVIYGGRVIQMHRQVMKYSGELVVDHRNGNGLDNRKANLRLATRRQNQFNRKQRCDAVLSKYKGVTFRKKTNKWLVRIGYNGERINLGVFDNEADAAKAYDEAAKELFGEFAALNFK